MVLQELLEEICSAHMCAQEGSSGFRPQGGPNKPLFAYSGRHVLIIFRVCLMPSSSLTRPSSLTHSLDGKAEELIGSASSSMVLVYVCVCVCVCVCVRVCACV